MSLVGGVLFGLAAALSPARRLALGSVGDGSVSRVGV